MTIKLKPEHEADFRRRAREARDYTLLRVPPGMTHNQAWKIVGEEIEARLCEAEFQRRASEQHRSLPCVAHEIADEPIHDAAQHGQQKAEPAWKQDAGKARMDLIAPEMLFGTAEVLAFGAAKYAERNWEQGMSWGRCFGALMRHMWAWWRGEAKDAETGLSHLWHASCCLMFLIAYEARNAGTDDRNKAVDSAK